MADVDISVVIATRDRPEKLAAALECLMAQQLPDATYEIIVVDDGSVSPAGLPEHVGQPHCTTIRLQGSGRSAARNTGALAATGKLLVFIDDDITVKNDFLQNHFQPHHEWADLLAVGRILLPKETQSTPFGRFRQKLESAGVPQSRGLTLMRNFCAAGNMSISRERFRLLGGFDESIESSEDQDFALRHTARGGRIVFLPEAEAIHNDTALDIRSYCARCEWGMKHIYPFASRHPQWPDNAVRDRINGRMRLGREPLAETLRKAAKLFLATKAALAALFACALLLECTAPRSRVLDRCYRILLGVHLFRGYRRALARPLSTDRISLSDERWTA